MSPDHTDFTLLKAALDLTSSLDLKAGLQNFVNQACALTSSPHATLAVLDTWGATTMQLEHHDFRPVPAVPDALTTAIPVASPLLVNSCGRTRSETARGCSAVPGRVGPGARTGLWAPLPHG